MWVRFRDCLGDIDRGEGSSTVGLIKPSSDGRPAHRSAPPVASVLYMFLDFEYVLNVCTFSFTIPATFGATAAGLYDFGGGSGPLTSTRAGFLIGEMGETGDVG